MVLPGRSSTPRIELPFGTTSVCQSFSSVAAASSLDVTILIGRLLATAVIAGITPTNANWSWSDISAGISAAPPSPTCGLIFRPSASKKPFSMPRYIGAALAIGSVPTLIVRGPEEPPPEPSELSSPPHPASASTKIATSAVMSPPRPSLSRIAPLPRRIDRRQGTPRARTTSPWSRLPGPGRATYRRAHAARSRSDAPAHTPARGNGRGHHRGLRDGRRTGADGRRHHRGLRDRVADDTDTPHTRCPERHFRLLRRLRRPRRRPRPTR